MVKHGKQKPAEEKPAREAVKGPEIKRMKAKGSIIRVVETNLDGGIEVGSAIRKIRGVGDMFSNAVSIISGFGNKKLQELSSEELKHLEDIIKDPGKFGIPIWMHNRRFDPSSGTFRHISASTLELTTKTDINEMKKLKNYKGVRHGLGLPLRGQRTRGSFRKGKTVGVSKKKQAPAKKTKK